ncbi:HD domain-containing protein [Actinomycetospora callitridis]|uniref:HD domain-containing protein n=1 Tax=Actinomycetospora callitridis TaxID=913944 RepID=UPI003B680B28
MGLRRDLRTARCQPRVSPSGTTTVRCVPPAAGGSHKPSDEEGGARPATGRTIAAALAHELLAPLGDRYRHTVKVAARAEELAGAVPPADRELLVVAAWWHDPGHARLTSSRRGSTDRRRPVSGRQGPLAAALRARYSETSCDAGTDDDPRRRTQAASLALCGRQWR